MKPIKASSRRSFDKGGEKGGPPDGWVTLDEATALSNLHWTTLNRLVREKQVQKMLYPIPGRKAAPAFRREEMMRLGEQRKTVSSTVIDDKKHDILGQILRSCKQHGLAVAVILPFEAKK